MNQQTRFEQSDALSSGASRRLDFAMSLKVVQQFERAFVTQRKVECALALLAQLVGSKSAILQVSSPKNPMNSRHPAVSNERSPARLTSDLYERITSAGEVWVIGHGKTARLTAQTPRGHIDWMVLVLRHEPPQPDLLLVQFDCTPTIWQPSDLIDLSKALAESWACAADSAITKEVNKSALPATGILSLDNPYNLTRSEFKVCDLLGQGNRPDAIARKLGVCMATVRTHLSNIYGKTGLASQMEVVHHLHARRQPTPAGQR